MPLISIIMPTYNRSKLLRIAINSVLQQSFQDFELIIVDDYSQDDTFETVNSIQSQKIRYVRHATNKGELASRNTGIRSSDSTYIALLDDDDEWFVNKLEKQILVIQDKPEDFGAVHTGFYYRDIATGNLTNIYIPRQDGYIFNELLYYNCIGASTILLKRECFEKAGLFDPEFKTGGDWDMWIRIAKNYKFASVKEALVYYNLHENNVTNSIPALIQGGERIIEKYIFYFKKSPRAYSYRCFVLGASYLLNNEISKSRDLFVKAIRLYPYHIRPYFYLFLSLTGSNKLTKGYLKVNALVKNMIRKQFASKTIT